MFELTVHFKHEIIGIWQRFIRNFELSGTAVIFTFHETVSPAQFIQDIRVRHGTQHFLYHIFSILSSFTFDHHNNISETKQPPSS